MMSTILGLLREGHPATHLANDAVTVKLIRKFPCADPKLPTCSVAAAVSTANTRPLGRVFRSRLFTAWVAAGLAGGQPQSGHSLSLIDPKRTFVRER